MTAALLMMVVAAAWTDVRTRRIPNVVTLGGFALALGLRALPGGAPVLAGVLGAGAAFAVAFPLFALGAFGGGDGKLLLAVGAFLGIGALPEVLLATALAGGVLSVFTLLRRRALLPTLVTLHAGLIGGGRRTLATPGSVAVPYGVAIAVGAVVGVLA